MIRYVDLIDYFAVAAEITGNDEASLIKASLPDLADSALHAPQAGFGGEDFYPDFVDKAAVLLCRLTWNHALPDGNKRTAWSTVRLFVAINADVARWVATPTVDEVEALMVGVAARVHDETDVANWLRGFLLIGR